MATFLRYRPVLTGFVGAPGINTWHGQGETLIPTSIEAQEWVDQVRAAYFAAKAYLAPGVSVVFGGEVTLHDEATGELTGVEGVTAPATVVSTSTAAEGQNPRASQSVVQLGTDVIRNGRRLKGRHFLGPASAFCFGSDGLLTTSARNGIVSAYGGVHDIAGVNLVVWGPPIYAKDAFGNPTDTLLAPGKKGLVTSVSVSVTPGTLRSRKG